MNYLTQLDSVLKTTGWSQDRLARELDVSFQTLNSWLNQRSVPRKKKLQEIELLHASIIGVDSIDEVRLSSAKTIVNQFKINADSIIVDKTLLDKLTLYLTYHTNTIEGSTMTLADVKDVIFDHKVLSNRTAIEQMEARNHQATLYWLLDKISKEGKSFVIDENLILDVHLRLMNGIISDAGQYRRHTVRIMGSSVALANWQKIPALLGGLIHTFNAPSPDIIKQMAETHAEFEKIHPFSDGNGRTGRLILLALSLRAGLVPPIVEREKRVAYYKYLEVAQTNANFSLLEMFICEAMQFSNQILSKVK